MTVNKYFGLLVKQAREEKGWTRQELADEMDADVRTIQKLEEEGSNPLYTTVASYLFLLDISPDIAFSPEQGEDGVLMDHIYRELLSLDLEQIQKVYDSAVYIRKWQDNHPEVKSLDDYWNHMGSQNPDTDG